MTQSNFSPQLSDEPENSSAATLAKYKSEIESIINVLLFSENLRKISEETIDAFEHDLREVVQGIEKLRHVSDLNQLLTSVEAVQENIKSAVNELYIALDVIEQQNTDAESSRRAFYICLNNCRRFLTGSLQYFTI